MSEKIPELKTLLPKIVAIARGAGREILDVYARDFSVASKADASPLTEADLRAQRVIDAGLKALTPNVPILSEEAALAPYSERRRWQELWLVDPLDGTREFVARNPEFTVNIALIRNGEPVLGVIHFPARDTDYYAAQGLGAFREKLGEPAVAVRVAGQAHSPLRILGSKSHHSSALSPVLEKLGPHQLLAVGSSFKFCLVAEGSADLYPRIGPTSEWDTAAGQAIVECAGGRVIDLQGRPLRYNARDSLINPDFLAYGDLHHPWLQYF